MESSYCPFLLLNAKLEIEPKSSVSVTDARSLIGAIFFFFIQRKVRKLRGGDFEYKLYWKGEETGRGGVGLMVKHDLVESVMEVRRVSPRIISIDIVVNEKVVTVISVYAPQSGRSEEEKEKFYEDLTAEVQSRHGICFVFGDFNGHVGRSSLGYDGIHGGFG